MLIDHESLHDTSPISSMSNNNSVKRKLDDINSNFTKSFIFKTIKEANPDKSEISVANLVNDHIKTNTHIFLKEPYKKKPPKGKSNKKPLSNKERKQLGLTKLNPGEATFEDLLPIHKLWCEYMSQLGLKDEELACADYHGCFLTVTKTTCPSLLRKSGIVAMESMNTFTIVDKDDKIHILPKQGTVFSFDINGTSVNIFGNNFLFRSGERTMKKVSRQRMINL